MIKFFRHFRQQLLTENKLSKYILYAIGEIVLVVIGILIAIQLNQWRNETSNNHQRQKVLQALQFEFQSNLAQLDTVLSFNSKIMNAYPEAMELIGTVDSIDNDSTFYKPLQHLGYNWSFDPINGALRSRISSGEIHLIENDRLLDLLFSWEDVVKDSQEESLKQKDRQTRSFELIQNYVRVGDLWSSVFPGTVAGHYPSNVRSLYKDVLFEDYVAFSFFDATEYERELNDIRSSNLEILELINQEVAKNP